MLNPNEICVITLLLCWRLLVNCDVNSDVLDTITFRSIIPINIKEQSLGEIKVTLVVFDEDKSFIMFSVTRAPLLSRLELYLNLTGESFWGAWSRTRTKLYQKLNLIVYY